MSTFTTLLFIKNLRLRNVQGENATSSLESVADQISAPISCGVEGFNSMQGSPKNYVNILAIRSNESISNILRTLYLAINEAAIYVLDVYDAETTQKCTIILFRYLTATINTNFCFTLIQVETRFK